MILGLIRRLPIQGILEFLLMVTSSSWILWNVGFENPTTYTHALMALMAIGAATAASLAYWVSMLLIQGVLVLWALLKPAVFAIRVKLGKVEAL